MKNKIVLVSMLTLATFMLVLPTHYVDAQSSSWTLSIQFRNVPFGASNIYTEIKGPFGYDQNFVTSNGPNPSASINLDGSWIPSGYQYQVCVNHGIISGLLNNNCHYFTHGNGDESIWIDVG
jgi:hypothetical protein